MRYLAAPSTYLLQFLLIASITTLAQPPGNNNIPTPEFLYNQQVLHEGYRSLKDTNLKSGNRYLLKQFKFQEQSTKFTGDSGAFEQLFEFLATHHEFWFEIAVHDYKYWDQDYKKDVTQARAAEISNYLIIHGIDPQRIFPKGYAFKSPIVSYAEIKPWWGKMDDKKAIRYNERVELVLMRHYKKKSAVKDHIKFALQSGRTDSLTSKLVVGQKFLVPGVQFEGDLDVQSSDFRFLKRFEKQHPKLEEYKLIIYDPMEGNDARNAKEGKKLMKKSLKKMEALSLRVMPSTITRIHLPHQQLFKDHYLQFIKQPYKDRYRKANHHMILEVTKVKTE